MGKIKLSLFNKTTMKITFLYFFTFCAVHSIDSFLFKTMSKMMGDDDSQAFIINYLCVVKFLASFLMPYIQMKLQNHKLLLIVLYFSFIVGLIFTHIVIRCNNASYKYTLAIISLIFYNIGTGAIFTVLEFVKINCLAKIRALHSVTVLSVGCCLGSGIGFLPSIIVPYTFPQSTEIQQLLIYKICAISFAIICICLTIFACPEFDYSPNFNYDNDPLENQNTNKLNFRQSIRGLFKLLFTNFSIFLLGTFFIEILQNIIKQLLRHFTSSLKMKQETTSYFQLLRIFFQISMYFCLFKVKKEKFIYVYNLICGVFCCLRPMVFYMANKNIPISKMILFSIQSALQAAESGFQQLSLSRICNNLSPSNIKVYAHGFYLSIRNGVAPLFANYICHLLNGKDKTITKETYNKIFSLSILMGGMTLLTSIILFLQNYKKLKNK